MIEWLLQEGSLKSIISLGHSIDKWLFLNKFQLTNLSKYKTKEISISFLLWGGFAEPSEAFSKAISCQSAGSLNIPVSSSKSVEAEFFYDFRNTHNSHILFVGEDEEDGILELIFRQHFLEFLSSDFHSFFIRRVDNVDQGLSVLIVMFPELSDLVLSSDIPNCELNILELDCFNVESDGWDWWNNLS